MSLEKQAASAAAIDEVINRRGSGHNFDTKPDVQKAFMTGLEKRGTDLSDKDVQRIQIYLPDGSRYKTQSADEFRKVLADVSEVLKAMQEADLNYALWSGCY